MLQVNRVDDKHYLHRRLQLAPDPSLNLWLRLAMGYFQQQVELSEERSFQQHRADLLLELQDRPFFSSPFFSEACTKSIVTI